jgi:glycosyltransferase involved in cell wall biosynthesis
MLSAFVVARNEQENLGLCLKGLAFADEIVVVLDRSTDASREIALAAGAKVVEGAWEIEGKRRHAAQAACEGPWILEIDADERVSPELAAEVKQTLQAPKGDWYRIPFDNYIGDRCVRYGWGAHFGVSARITLYKKGVKNWGDQRVHPKVKMEGQSGGALENRIAHYVDRNISEMLQRLDRYSTLNAEDMAGSGREGTYRKNVARIFGRIWKCYVLRKGYREGGLGLLIAICAGLYPFLSYLKVKEIEAKRR